MHAAVKALGQPGQQTGLGFNQIHTGHANLGKSQFTRPSLGAGYDLSSMVQHLPIVETTPSAPRPAEVRLHWATEDDTQAFAQRLAALDGVRNAVVELHGDLGAGKTTLVRHLLRALGVGGRIKSPTYAVVEPHEAPATPHAPALSIWHFDFYRFTDPREWEDAGFRDVFASPGLKLLEWADNARAVLPPPDLTLALQTQADDSRAVALSAHTPHGQALLRALTA